MKHFDSFIEKVKEASASNDSIDGVAVGGSYATEEIDSYSDIDFVIILKNGISFHRDQMISFASSFGNLLSSFTGEHVGEKQLLICLYESPLLHVDFKFIQVSELKDRIENPKLIYHNNSKIISILENSYPHWPHPDFQWIEDRFWVWIHYVATKLGRGEWFEAIDFLSFLRTCVLGPLLHTKYNSLPRSVRKLEFIISEADLHLLKATIPAYDFDSIYDSILTCVDLYNQLRLSVFDSNTKLFEKAERHAIEFLKKDIKKK
jgi:predicted nucleotidyltransferase